MAALVRALHNDFVVGNGFFGRLANLAKVWNERTAARRELAELSFQDIQDIGLDQAELNREIAKPFWRA